MKFICNIDLEIISSNHLSRPGSEIEIVGFSRVDGGSETYDARLVLDVENKNWMYNGEIFEADNSQETIDWAIDQLSGRT